MPNAATNHAVRDCRLKIAFHKIGCAHSGITVHKQQISTARLPHQTVANGRTPHVLCTTHQSTMRHIPDIGQGMRYLRIGRSIIGHKHLIIGTGLIGLPA